MQFPQLLLPQLLLHSHYVPLPVVGSAAIASNLSFLELPLALFLQQVYGLAGATLA
jgi:hypothetical protein